MNNGLCMLIALFFSLSSLSCWAQNQTAAAGGDEPTMTSDQKLPSVSIKQQEALKILYYRPMYFAYGEPLTKVQMSFRVPLFEEVPLNFAYTQIMFWEFTKNSKPFLDSTYNPEFFYRVAVKDGPLQHIDLGLWEHNSNGKGGEDSRSYNNTYLRANLTYDTPAWLWQFVMKIQYLYNKDDTNRDIGDYVSPLEFQLKFLQRFDSWFDHLEIIFNFNPGGKYGTEWNKGGYQLSFDFHLGGLKVVPAFYLQYYHGYAETLLNYNEKVDEFRGGLMF